jgi:2'-phosphotransferase
LNTRALKGLRVTFPELREVVASNEKQRFSMILASALDKPSSQPLEEPQPETLATVPESDEPSDYLIRANQGHSIKVDTEGLLTPITKEAGNVPDTVIHGTDDAAWRLILKSGGLRRMTRNHIHFAAGLPAGFKALVSSSSTEPVTTEDAQKEKEKEAPPVISGMRKSSTVLIYIDINAALDSGIKSWLSENGVVLSEGNEKGLLPYEFFKKVEHRKQGVVLMSDGKLPDGAVVDVEGWEKEVGDGERKGKGKGKRGGRGGKGRGGGKARANDDERDLLAGV